MADTWEYRLEGTHRHVLKGDYLTDAVDKLVLKMNELGAEGWELVSEAHLTFDTERDHYHGLTFKRRISS